MRMHVRRALVAGLSSVLLGALVLVAPPSAGQPASESPVSVTTVVGDPTGAGPATSLSVPPFGVAEHQGDLLIAAGKVVRRLDLDTGQLTTFAGVGGAHFSRDRGDGGPARDAVLSGVGALAVGQDGSVYLAEGSGNRVRRVRPDGVIETVAGNGSQMFSGDGGPATEAGVYWPAGLALAGDGSLFVSDHYNNRIRRITPDGTIHTVAGNGTASYSGDDGPALQAGLQQPSGLALMSDGSLLVADTGNHRIRKISGGTITTIAGTGTPAATDDSLGDGSGDIGDGGPARDATLHFPTAVRVDGDGLLVSDTRHQKVRRIAANGTITTVVGGGKADYGRDGVPATETSLLWPEDVLRLSDGRLVVADTHAKRVRIVGSDGLIHGVAGNYYYAYSGDEGPATRAQLGGPSAVAVAPQGDVYVLDHGHYRVVRRVDATTGTIETIMGLANDGRTLPRDGDPAVSALLTAPSALAADGNGMLYVTDEHVIRQVDVAAGTQRVYAGTWGVGQDAGDGTHRLQASFVRPAALVAAADGSLYVGDTGANRVRRIDADGNVHPVAGTGTAGFSGDGGAATAAQLAAPGALALDDAGTLYIIDAHNARIRAVTKDGSIRTVVGAGPGLAPPELPSPPLEAVIAPLGGLSVLPDGSLVFSEGFWDLLRYDPRAGLVARLAGTGDAGFRDGDAAAARFAVPEDLAWDAARQRLLVADLYNERIRAVLGAMDADSSAEPRPAPSPTATPSPSTQPTAAPDGGQPPVPRARAFDDACPRERVGEDGFADVPAESAHEAAIDCIVHWQVAYGRTSSHYDPGATVTRAQMASFIARLVQQTTNYLPEPTRDHFSDDDGAVHERSIDLLAAAGIVSGRAPGVYDPSAAVTRAQMAAFLTRAYEHMARGRSRQLLSAGGDYFRDDDGTALEIEIDKAAEAGFTGGYADGTYRPAGSVSREQMASFLARVLDLAVEEGMTAPP